MEVKGTDNYVRFDSAISVNTFICERTINSNLELIRIVNPLESDIKINGDLIINYSGVKLNANGHKITVEGDLIHSNGNIYVGKGEILIKGNYNSTKNGIMYMENEEDYVCVEGDFYIATTSHKDNWIAGVLEVKGDFTQERNPSNGSTNNFVAKGSHKTILSGLKEQVVKFSNTSSYFNILEVKGTDNYVRFDSVISVNTFICQRTINSNLKLKKIINPLEGSLIVNGDLTIDDANSVFDINGHTVLINGNMNMKIVKKVNINNGELIVKGNLLQETGELYVNKGKLLINGDYIIPNGSAKLYMVYEEDYVFVRKNFKIQASRNDNLTAGVLEVQGDFIQRDYLYGMSDPWNPSSSYHLEDTFIASGTHKVLLSGEKTQIIDFESPIPNSSSSSNKLSRFNILIINKPIEYGYMILSKDKPTTSTPWRKLEIIYTNSNPLPGTTITKPSLIPPREGLGMAEVNGRIYAFGGKTDDNEYLNTVSEYDYIADKWTEYIDDPDKQMLTGKSNFAIAATDNDIYIFGGFDGTNYFNTVERYNPAIGEFIFRDSIPPMPTARSEAKAVLIDNKIYVVGGINETGFLNTIEVYDIENNTWTTLTDNTNIPRADFGMATYGKKIYIFGGYNENGILDIVEEYDTTTGICTEKTSLPIKTRGLQALSIDGKIYLFCGTTFDGTTTKVTNAVDRYDPQTNTYLSIEADKDPNDNIVRLRPLQYARTSFGAVAAFGRAFIAAGNDGTKCIGAAGEYVVNQIKGTTFGADYNGTEGRGTQYDSNGANVLTGNYLTQSVDISLEGPYMNVEVVRSYNSSDADTEDELVIGNGWRMSFETFIKKVDSNTYRVKASSLNLRKAPSNIGDAYPTDWPIIRGIANGTILRHTGRVINWPGHSDWYEVITPNNQTGWVCAYYLEKVPGIEVTYPTGTKIVFTADGANYKAPVGCFDELTKTTVDGISMYKLKKKDQTVYLYYADTGKLAYQEDRYGNRIKFYYENGKLKKIFDCDATGNEIGRTLTLEYEGGKLKSISDKAGRSVTYSYTDGKLTSVKNLNDKVTKYEYYNEGEGSKNKIKTIKKVDDNNNEIALYTNFYDGLGRIIKQVDSNNKASYYLYTDLSIDDTSEMTTNGLEVSRQYYNRRGDLTKEIYNINFPDRPIRVIDPIEKVTETKYYLLSGNNYVDTTYFTDQMLRKEENRKLWENNLPQKFETAEIIETENGKKAVNKTIIETDEKSNVILVKNPDDTVKRYKYYENGDLQYVIDEMNYLTYYYYETLGNDIKRLKNIIKPVLPVDPENPIKNVTDVSIFDKDKTAITTYEYEDTKIKSLVKKIINPNGTYTEYEYYDNGMLKSSSNGINTLQYTYDNCFRVESETTDLGNKTIYEYDKMNNITKITRIADGEEPSITRMFYDYDGRKKQEINSLMYDPAYDNGTGYSGTVSDLYDYDAYGRLLKHTQYVKNVDGSVNSYVYSYTYDGEGNLEKEINPSGGTYVYNYDGLGRVTAIYFGSTLLEKYTYNEYVNLDNGTYGTEKVQTKYLSSYKENNQTKYKTADTKYLMDYAGRIVKVTNPTEGDVEEFTKTEYYKDGKVRKVTDPRGNSTYYTYNKYDSTNPGMVYDEKFVPVTEVNGNIKYSYSKTTYDLSGRKVAETTYADLVEITEGDDGKISIKVKDESTEVRYIETKYEYYDNNKVKRISSYGVDTANTPIKSTMEKVTEYRYDKDGNLVEEKAIFDSDKQNINVYLDYNMYGKPQKTAVLISNEDLEKDLYVNEREKITAYSDLFTESTKNENYGYNPDYENYSAIVTTYTNFDKAGNPGTVISPNTQTVKYYYDSLGRVGKQTVNDKDISDINGSGFETTIEKIMTYNWEGKVTGTSVYAHNETGRKLLSSEQNQYNSRGLLEKTIQKGITTKEFNRNTNKETVKTQDLTTAYEYDLAGRVVAEVTPENYVGYKDGQGLLATGTTNKIEYIYDKQGRLILKAFRGKIKNYNGSTGNFNENERYIVIEAYKYDANGNVIKKVDGEAYNKAYEDAVNQQKSVAVEDLINDAYGVEYTYNLANQLETVKNPEFTGANGMNFNRKYSYDGLGRVVGETTAHGLNKTLIIENVNTPVQVSGLYYSITKYLYDDVNRKLDVSVVY
ncbi:Kelch repeat-containing protein [Acetivibrio clariflavus]|uniref:Kelch repeat-containing protein n=1 Tax=Acetivibrio clariflavus TaxID=288965 RepID=UPI0004870A2A|nr:kelch repeat-containing protein [Acetivibrio clariflavus]